MNLLVKVLLSALMLVAVSEASKRSTVVGGLLASLPLTSILAFIWLYRDTRDPQAISTLSMSIFWLVIPSLVLFLTLPFLLKRMAFPWALGGAVGCTLIAYGLMLGILRLLHVRI